MKKRLWIIAAALLFTGTAAFYMLACAYLPDKIKEILVTQARETLGRRLSFDDVIYDPLKGLSVTNLTLYQKGDDRSPLLHVRKVHFNVLLAPLLLNKQAVIPSITITEPYVFLIREGETTWNFSDLLARRKPAAGKPKISVSVGGINIEKGRIEIADKTRPGAPVRILADTDLRASVSLTKDIRFSIAARPSEKSSLKADGIYALSRRELTADIDAQDLDAFSWLGLFPPSPIFTPRGGTVQMASLRVQHKGQKLRITGNLIFPQADMTFCPRGADQPCHTVRGDASATGIDFVRDGAAYFRFEGNTKVGRADLLFDNRTLIQGDLSAPALEVTRQNGKLKITGSAEGKGMHVEVSREHRIDGDAQLTGLTFIKNGLDFHLKAKAVIKKGRYAGSGKNLSADLASQALEVTRKDGKTAVEGDLTAANAALTVGDDTWTLTGQLSSPRLYFVQDNGSFYVKGGAELTDGDLTVGKQVKAKGRLKADSAEVLFKDGGLNVRAGGLLFENGSVITPDKNIAGTFSSKDSVLGLKDGRLTLESDLTIAAGRLALPGDKILTGNPSLQIKLDHALDGSETVYAGTVDFNNSDITGLDRVGDARGVRGKMSFDNLRARSSGLTFRAFDTELQLSGSVKNFTDPEVDIQASADRVDLGKMSSLFADELAGYGLSPSGLADVNLRYRGLLKPFDPAGMTLTASVSGGTLEGKKLPAPVQQISGTFTASGNNLAWDNARALYQGTRYALTGRLKDFKNPLITTTAESDFFKIETTAEISGEEIRVRSLSGTLYDAPVNIRGTVSLPPGASPVLDVSGTARLKLDQLAFLPESAKTKIKDMKLRGDVSVEASFQGSLQEWKTAKCAATATADKLSLNGLTFDGVTVKIDQGTRIATYFSLSGGFYGGRLQVDAQAETQKADMPFFLSAKILDTDLALLKQDLKSKNFELGGRFLFDLSLEGPLAKTEKIKGRGSAQIQDGNIGKYDVLKGVWKILLLKDYENMILTYGRVNFEVRNKRVLTEDLFMSGDTMELSGKGWAGFDQRLSFLVMPKFKEFAILSSQDGAIKKTPTLIMAKAADVVGVKITGTLQYPQYEKVILPGKILEKSSDTIREGVGTILEEIFNF